MPLTVDVGEPDVEVIADELEVTALQITLELEGVFVEVDSTCVLIDLTYHLATRPPMVNVNGDDTIYVDGGLWVVDNFVVTSSCLTRLQLLASNEMYLRDAKG